MRKRSITVNRNRRTHFIEYIQDIISVEVYLGVINRLCRYSTDSFPSISCKAIEKNPVRGIGWHHSHHALVMSLSLKLSETLRRSQFLELTVQLFLANIYFTLILIIYSLSFGLVTSTSQAFSFSSLEMLYEVIEFSNLLVGHARPYHELH